MFGRKLFSSINRLHKLAVALKCSLLFGFFFDHKENKRTLFLVINNPFCRFCRTQLATHSPEQTISLLVYAKYIYSLAYKKVSFHFFLLTYRAFSNIKHSCWSTISIFFCKLNHFYFETRTLFHSSRRTLVTIKRILRPLFTKVLTPGLTCELWNLFHAR